MISLFPIIDPRRLIPATLMTLFLLVGSAPGAAATLEIIGPEGASIVVNEQIMGFLPLSHPLDLPPGDYLIRSELPGYQNFETRVQLAELDDWQRLQIRPVRLSKRVAWMGNLVFAGLGQHTMGKSFKGYVFNIVEAGGLLTALAGELQRSNYRKDYILFKELYDTALAEDDIAKYRLESAKAYANMEDMESVRNMGLAVAGSAVVLSILDALINFPDVETGAGTVPLQTGSLAGEYAAPSDLGAVHAGIRLVF